MVARYPPNMSTMPVFKDYTFYNDIEQLFAKVRMELGQHTKENPNSIIEELTQMEGDTSEEDIELRKQELLAEARTR